MVILCLIMALALSLFFLYHLSMIDANVTTNEKVKRSDFIAFFKSEVKKLGKLLE